MCYCTKFFLIILLCGSTAFGSLLKDKNLVVSNAIVPMNSQFAHQLNATIAFSTDSGSVTSGQSDTLQVDDNSIGIIIISAPFCGEYLGYVCSLAVPQHCIARIHKSGQMLISGVMSQYGLDLMSLRCSFMEEAI